MTRKRSREEMCEQILREARSPEATVASIVQLVSLSWLSWKDLCERLMRDGLLIVVDGHYRATDKGLDWLEMREKSKAVFVA